MKNEPIDRILSSDEELIPSSGFASSVMDRIRDEAAAPPPIPFPWKRVAPGLAVACAGLAWGSAVLVRELLVAAHTAPPAVISLPAWVLLSIPAVKWSALALGVSLVAGFASRRIVD